MPAFIAKALLTTLKSLLFLASVVIFTVLVLTGTEGGSAWLIRKALDTVNEGGETRISVRQISGTFFGDLSFTELLVEAAGENAGSYSVAARTSLLALNPLALFDAIVDISLLEINGLTIDLGPTAQNNSPPSDPREQFAALFNLPVQFSLQEFEIRNVRINTDEQIRLNLLQGNLVLDSRQLDLNTSFALDVTNGTANIELLADNLDLTGNIAWQTVFNDEPASGSLALSGNPETLALTHTLSAPVQVRSEGQLQTGILTNNGLTFDLQHQFNALSGETFNVPALQELSGNVVTNGSPEQISLGVTAQALVDALGQLQIDFDAQYAGEQLSNMLFTLTGDNFNLTGTGNAVLGDAPALDLDWQLADFSDGDLISAVVLEGLDAEGSVTATSNNGELQSAFQIDALTGELNGYPLSGMGNLALAGNEVRDIALTLESGSNSLFLEGTVDPELAISWQLQTPLLERLLPDLTGQANGQGSLSGTPADPRINGVFTASNVAYRSGENNLQVASLDANAIYASDNNELSLTFAGLDITSVELNLHQDAGEFSVTGLGADHQITLGMRSEDFSLALQAQGGLLDGTWSGTLDTALINSLYGNWRLQDTLQMNLSFSEAQFSSHCWEMDELLLCAQANWLEANGLAGNLAVDNLPLAYLNKTIPAEAPGLGRLAQVLANRPAGLEQLQLGYNAFMPESSFIDGEMDLTMDFAGVGGNWSETTLSMILAPRDLSLGLIRLPALEEETDAPQVETYGIDEVLLTVDRLERQWRANTEFEIYLTESGGLDFQGNFGGEFIFTDDEALGGNFELSFNNIAWVEALVPMLRNVDGEFGASGSLSGNLDAPQLLMDARLDNGRFELPEYGLTLEAVNLEFASDSGNELSMRGSAQSGLGSIALESRMTTPLQNSRSLHVEITGEDFLLINLPESRAVVNPDLEIDLISNVLNVNGSLEVPVMQIDLRSSQALANVGSVDVSRDAVILVNPDGSQPVSTTSAGLTGQMPIAGEIMLSMGDEVRFQGFGLNVFLTGDLLLEQSSNRPLLAHGELSIPMGSYGLYGQQLNIEDGKLLFLGNPLNPALDILAVRQTRAAEVGVLMNGTVRNIRAQLFSTPALPEGEILALLITGNSFSRTGEFGNQDGQNMLGAVALLGLEKGQGLTGNIQSRLGIDTLAINSGADYRDSALGLGKYLSPRLFMRYDIGLFDRENALSLDYTLTERVKLEVESGVSQSIDLTYTVEK